MEARKQSALFGIISRELDATLYIDIYWKIALRNSLPVVQRRS